MRERGWTFLQDGLREQQYMMNSFERAARCNCGQQSIAAMTQVEKVEHISLFLFSLQVSKKSGERDGSSSANFESETFLRTASLLPECQQSWLERRERSTSIFSQFNGPKPQRNHCSRYKHSAPSQRHQETSHNHFLISILFRIYCQNVKLHHINLQLNCV